MRIIGIDPGTYSFDYFGMEGDQVIADGTISTELLAQNPGILLDSIEPFLPVDLIVGPSGYGLPLVFLEKADEALLRQTLPEDSGDVKVNEGIFKLFQLLKSRDLPVLFTPGVIHLTSVPRYRKANKLDMGTADKVCCVALALRDQVERLRGEYSAARFILVEVGYGFTAVIGIDHGQIVDGIGGTMGGPGFLSLGGMDAELAIRFGKIPQWYVFTGGVRDFAQMPDLTPEALGQRSQELEGPFNLLFEGLEKDVAAMTVSVPAAPEIIISGRLTQIPQFKTELMRRLKTYGTVLEISSRKAKVAKEAAEGAYIIGEGVMGGQYQTLVASLELAKSSGTMYDHIYFKGITR